MWRPLATLCFLLGARCEAKKLNFFQISDLHLDSRYSEDGSVRTACHDIESNSTDGGGQQENQSQKLGAAGDYSCVAPLALVESAIRHMKTIQPNPDFILWSGDSREEEPSINDVPKFAWIWIGAIQQNLLYLS